MKHTIKQAKSEWAKYMKATMRSRKKWLQEIKNHKELLSVKLLNEDTFQEVLVKSMYTLESAFIDVNRYIKDNDEGLLIRIKNKTGTSIINLTNVSPYVILFFEENLEFKGASYSLNSGTGSYCIQTQYKTVLFIKHPNTIKLNKIEHLSLIEN